MQGSQDLRSVGAMAVGERSQVVFGEKGYTRGGHRRAGPCRTCEQWLKSWKEQ